MNERALVRSTVVPSLVPTVARIAGSLAVGLAIAPLFACSTYAPPRELGASSSAGAITSPSLPGISDANPADSWSARAAAAYLDQRTGWWMQWSVSARDHGTVCVSCHTGVPYVLATPALRGALGDANPSPEERILLDDVMKRVRLGKNADPYYKDEGYDPKTAQSRGTEAVLNALILASNDAQSGQLRDDTRTALANLWTLQKQSGAEKGAWSWLQFDLSPWEARDSAYYGATLAALAVGTAPDNYAASSDIQPNLALLRDYLNGESAGQSTMNHIFLLWAATRWPDLLAPARRQEIIQEVLGKQQRDGGWRSASLAWKWNGWRSLANAWFRADGTPLEGRSDGVATGLASFVLQAAGVGPQNPQLQGGLRWLERNQNKADGSWAAWSLNKRRSESSDIGRFMDDAATAYAVLALTESASKRAASSTAAGKKLEETPIKCGGGRFARHKFPAAMERRAPSPVPHQPKSPPNAPPQACERTRRSIETSYFGRSIILGTRVRLPPSLGIGSGKPFCRKVRARLENGMSSHFGAGLRPVSTLRPGPDARTIL